MNTGKTICIDTDTLNDGADLAALRRAIVAEFPGVDVEIKSTGRGTEHVGFGEGRDDAERRVRAIVDRLDF